jgi:type III pantothenate kinase
VNPPVLARARDALPALRVVGEEIALPLPVLYEPPGDLGRDRVMAAVGALDRRPDAPGVLVLDAGTCLVATVAVRGLGVLGGAILPGPDLMARALADGTAVLPRVPVEAAPPAIGRSTADSIRAGIDAAIAGAVRELIDRCRAETHVDLDVVAAGTGGGALAARVPGIDAVHPFATLWGVYRSATA